MIALPFLTGLFPSALLPSRRRSVPLIFLSGYLVTYAVLELLGVPILLLTGGNGFQLLLHLFVAASILLSAAGLYCMWRTGGTKHLHILQGRVHLDKEVRSGQGRVLCVVLWGIFLLLAVSLAAYGGTRAIFDGDDSYYVVQSVQTWQYGVMYQHLPYTGTSTVLDARHALAMLPMWFAILGRLTGTHPTILIHSMSPALYLALSDCAYYLLAEQLFEKEKESRRRLMLPAFMILLTALQLFGATSIYTPEYFLLMRPWQGKSVFVAVLLPAAVWLLLEAGHSGQKWIGILLAALTVSACLCSSMAPVLLTGMLLLAYLLLAIRQKDKKLLRILPAFLIPAAVYLVLLVLLLLPQLLWSIFGG